MIKNSFSKRLIASLLSMTLAAAAFIAAPAITAQAATSKKGVYVTTTFDGAKWNDKKSDEYNQKQLEKNRYSIAVRCPQKAKLTKTMKMSFTIYVPVAALKKDWSKFQIDCGLQVGNDKNWGGYVDSKYNLRLENYFGAIALIKGERAKNYKQSRASNIAKFKKAGNYYVVTVKDMPLSDKLIYFDEKTKQDKVKELPTNKTSYITPDFGFGGEGQKMDKSKVFVTDISVTTAKTFTISFNKKDEYAGVYGWCNRTNKGVKARVATIQ